MQLVSVCFVLFCFVFVFFFGMLKSNNKKQVYVYSRSSVLFTLDILYVHTNIIILHSLLFTPGISIIPLVLLLVS